MIDNIEKNLCTGCNCCVNICPQNAVIMKTDNEGFWYPHVDHSKCSRCELCIKKCPILSDCKCDGNNKIPDVFAAWSNDEHIRFNSTSGGIFSELAQFILNQGGYVVGAQYRSDFTVEHCLIDKAEDIEKLRQSKYMQSDIGLVFRDIKKVLLSGKMLLFCGTPCQNAAMINYLGREYDNLYLCDFICRGVLSPMVFMKYLEMLNNKYKSTAEKVIFKNKDFGWNRFSTKIKFLDGQVYIRDRYQDSYMVGYLQGNLYLRPSCYNCRFKKLPRISDITLGDFWGVGQSKPHLDQNKGTSVIMINSGKGQFLYESIKAKVYSESCTLDEVSKGNICLFKSAEGSTKRESFFRNIDKIPFDRL